MQDSIAPGVGTADCLTRSVTCIPRFCPALSSHHVYQSLYVPPRPLSYAHHISTMVKVIIKGPDTVVAEASETVYIEGNYYFPRPSRSIFPSPIPRKMASPWQRVRVLYYIRDADSHLSATPVPTKGIWSLRLDGPVTHHGPVQACIILQCKCQWKAREGYCLVSPFFHLRDHGPMISRRSDSGFIPNPPPNLRLKADMHSIK